ncbi:MAG: gliding motility lipoprotein GldD [Bacteroidia bacterium]|nr:MAG: gliding motility lipoprotein GldD [Bacteroidia bacterium]
MGRLFVLVFFFSLLLVCCKSPDTPLPRAYFRIAMPERDYRHFDEDYPFSFAYPGYAGVVPDTRETAEPYWSDIVYPDFRGRIHLSYKPVGSQRELAGLFEDARTFVHRHIPKATAIREEVIMYPDRRVYGMLYHIRGREAASPIQFYLTDSVDHFLRGALYFHVRPNNDSLAPVIEFIEEDIRHFFDTFEWQ